MMECLNVCTRHDTCCISFGVLAGVLAERHIAKAFPTSVLPYVDLLFYSQCISYATPP